MIKKGILMAVFNPIDYDSRTQRAAYALSERYEVTVFAVDSGRGYRHSQFNLETVQLPDRETVQAKRNYFKKIQTFVVLVAIMVICY